MKVKVDMRPEIMCIMQLDIAPHCYCLYGKIFNKGDCQDAYLYFKALR